MSAGMNNCVFSGRLGRDAELRTTQNGKKVLNFPLAVEIGFGENKTTMWIDCALWGDRGERLVQHLVKGKEVVISGSISLTEFITKRDGSGAKDKKLSLTVNDIQMFGGGQSAKNPESGAGNTADGFPVDDEMPF